MVDAFARRRLGRSTLEVTQLGFGGASLGDAYEVLPEAQAEGALEAAFAAGIGHFDTSPWYGNGKSEMRFGRVLRTKPRASFTLTTKIGRVYFRPKEPDTFFHERWVGGLAFDRRFDYTRDGVLRSYEQSMLRLGLNRIDGLLIHDLDLRHQLTDEGIATRIKELEDGKGWQALADLKASGEIKAIGAGINHLGMIPRFLKRFDIDFFLLAMPYTLMEQEALDEELPLCQERGVSIVIGAPYASGILARGPRPGAMYGYKPAEPHIIAKAEKIAAVCARHNVSLAAAALQFPLAHPVVASVIPGPVSAEEVRLNFAAIRHPIPDALWDELKQEGLIRADAPTPKAGA
jgi:D-threo-aldose 1-dehydrogenase